ncbi:VanZ family protein [Hymenobacter amundsenii]|uniref:VanZ family protein n=2 Tax=Hymenobacter amundsenii TaxID=2006685 RepID=A0A246FQI4_9BACT|nr:VanZ family protein [Hymenobacter amundsenii]
MVSTLTPSADMPPLPHWQLLSFDTAAHAFVFGVLAVLGTFSARRQQRWPWLHRHAFGAVFGFSVALGALVEILQMRMALGRHGEWSDLLSDALGVAAGTLLIWATRHRWQ